MKKHMLILPVFLVAVVALILGGSAHEGWAQVEFEEAEFNIEFNSTDEDLGVRAFIDGEPYKEVNIIDEDGRTIAKIKGKKSMADQGYAELFYESGEPTLLEVPILDFLSRFPEGTYEFEGETIEGDEIEGDTEFTHDIPCGPDAALDADVDYGTQTVTISWSQPTQVVNPLTTVSGNVQCIGPAPTIVAYEVILEGETGDAEDIEYTFKLPDDDPFDLTEELVLPLYLFPDGDYAYEVIAIEDSGNQTITEDDFLVARP